MTEPDLVGLFVAPLEGLGLGYMITGGVASVIYGDPRFTRDIDLILELREADAGRLLERRVRVPLEDHAAIWLAPPEYVVVRKLQYYEESGSDRHLRDVAAMLEISREKITIREVEGWAHRLGLEDPLRAARAFNQ